MFLVYKHILHVSVPVRIQSSFVHCGKDGIYDIMFSFKRGQITTLQIWTLDWVILTKKFSITYTYIIISHFWYVA